MIKNGIADRQTLCATPPIDGRPVKTAVSAKLDRPSSANATMPYRGTSKSKPTSTTTSIAPPKSDTPATENAKALKKGSFAEIMARATASQSKPPVIGVISHKPQDKAAISYKKELKLKKQALKNKKLGIKDSSRPGSSGSLSSNPAPASTNKKKVPEPAYKGTAKPRPQPSYKGTMKAGSTAAQKQVPKDRDGYASRQRYNEYAATDEDDLDDVEEDEFDSEGSDDMEAGFSDVEQEESAAAKAARKEDEEEARLEAKLKNEKEERKRKLEAMAKKAKPQRY